MFDSLKESGTAEFFLQFALELPIAEISLATGLACIWFLALAARAGGALPPSTIFNTAVFAPPALCAGLAAYLVNRRARSYGGSLFRGNAWIAVLLLGATLLAYAQYLIERNYKIMNSVPTTAPDYFMRVLDSGYQDPLGIAYALAFPGLGAALYGIARLAFRLNALRRRGKGSRGPVTEATS